MSYLKIHCGYCRNDWTVYRRSMNERVSRECPHCQHEIDDQTWNNHVIPALCEATDMGIELIRDNLQYHRPVFKIDILADKFMGEIEGYE